MNILIVEDERGLRDALIKSLNDEGYTADGAEDGEMGLAMVETNVYDFVLLDIMLPKMSGLKVLEKMRAAQIDVPVILLTARTRLDDKIEGMDCGADDYLTKPFEMDELFARIRMVARRSHKVSVDRTVAVGDLLLNLQTYELSSNKNDKKVRLGTKEFQLMEYMMYNAGQVLSREQITEKIWGFDSEAEYNNVDVYVSFVRKKIQFVGAGVRITSVRGVGYQLEVIKED